MHGLAEVAAVDGDDHLVVNLVTIRLQRVGIVGLAVRHQAVDDAVGRVLARIDDDFLKFKGDGFQRNVAFLCIGL